MGWIAVLVSFALFVVAANLLDLPRLPLWRVLVGLVVLKLGDHVWDGRPPWQRN